MPVLLVSCQTYPLPLLPKSWGHRLVPRHQSKTGSVILFSSLACQFLELLNLKFYLLHYESGFVNNVMLKHLAMYFFFFFFLERQSVWVKLTVIAYKFKLEF